MGVFVIFPQEADHLPLSPLFNKQIKGLSLNLQPVPIP